jgi:hypothetical protein
MHLIGFYLFPIGNTYIQGEIKKKNDNNLCVLFAPSVLLIYTGKKEKKHQNEKDNDTHLCY